MGLPDRSFGTVVEDILGNFQAIIRAEMRLARTEFRQEIKQGQAAALALGLGVLAGMYSILFLLLATVNALSQRLPSWAAALIVALGLALFALIGIAAGRKRFRNIEVAAKTAQTLKE